MSTKMISKASIMAYLHQLECDEKASATIEKYRHDINLFYEFLPDEKVLTKEDAIRYKQYSVSYTHLDVYKRQVHFRMSSLCLLVQFADRTSSIAKGVFLFPLSTLAFF